MRHAKTLLAAAAVILLTAPAFAQVTPGGPGERKNNQSPPMTSSQSPAGAQPMTAPDHAARGVAPRAGTTGMAPGQADSGQKGARKANEAPMLKH